MTLPSSTAPRQTPALASSNGKFVVTSSAGTDTLSNIEKIQFNNETITLSLNQEFQVNTVTSSIQTNPAITALIDGGYVITWESYGQDGSVDIYAQSYNSAGIKVGDERQINTFTNNYQFNPAITALSDGGYVITWVSNGQDGSQTGIYAQRYNSAGDKVGDETQINTFTTSFQDRPAITTLTDGGYVITWESIGQGGGGGDVYAQRYNSGGEKVGAETLINTTTGFDQLNADITALSDGGYVITWESNNQDGFGNGIYAQRFNSAGFRVGFQPRINTTTTGEQECTAITALSDGGYVIAYSSTNLDGTSEIYAQRFSADGSTTALSISGDANANTLNYAGTVSMTLLGLGGNDSLIGDIGNDKLDGGVGNDTMIGGLGNDIYLVDSTSDVVTETSTLSTEIDTVNASASYTLGANVENLTLKGTTTINGTGNGLKNTLIGNSAANKLDGQAEADTMSGGDGSDVYVVDNIGDTVVETNANAATGGTDTVESTVSFTLGTNVENLTLKGLAIIGTGNGLKNTLIGNSLANKLDGQAEADTMSGGDGSDVYVVDNIGDTVVETNADAATGGTDTVESTVSFTLGANVENLTLKGITAINGTGNALNNTITGNSGNNILEGKDGSDVYVVDNIGDTVVETNADVATGGTDTVESTVSFTLGANVENLTLKGTTAINGTGNGLKNTLIGNSAGNRLDGGIGADTMSGGDGSDVYVVGNISDTVIETNADAATGGTDTVESSITYTLGANVENLTLTGTTAINGTGNELDNTLTGNSGNNTLNGGTGNDTMIGGLGNDTYVVDSARDVVTETSTLKAEIDTVNASVSYTLGANLENLILTGTTASNGTGNSLSNVLIGNSGKNILTGGSGKDTLTGGDGADIFDFNALTDSVVGANRDIITDFSAIRGDKIDLSTIDANSVTAGDQAFSSTILTSGTFTQIGQLKLEGGILYGNTDSNFATAEFEIALTGVTTLSAASLVL